MKTQYYTKQEDGSFHPVTLTQTNISEILVEAFRDQLRSVIADNIAKAIEDLDLASEAQSAIEDVDTNEIAQDAIREEIENRIGSMDIDVSVSL